jgi:hypothetical protein
VVAAMAGVLTTARLLAAGVPAGSAAHVLTVAASAAEVLALHIALVARIGMSCMSARSGGRSTCRQHVTASHARMLVHT